jgi:hypothetical protein
LLCSRWRKRMWYETETKMSMVQYAFCVMNNNIDYSLVSYIRTMLPYFGFIWNIVIGLIHVS